MRLLKKTSRRPALAVLAATVLVGACAAPGDSRQRLVNFPLSGKAVLLGDIDSVKNCKEAAICDQAITVSGTPTLPLFDCGIKVDSITLAQKGVKSLRWTLPPAETGKTAYRFRVAPNGKESIGIFVTDGATAFSGAVDPTDSRTFVLTFLSEARKTQAFKYGVFLDYKPVGNDKEWAPCAPLDPIIVGMD